MASHGVPRTNLQTGPRDEKLRQKELKQIEEYNAIVSKVQSLRSEKRHDAESLSQTAKLLKQNPEFYTIWNYRRQILLHLFDEVPPSTTTETSTTDAENNDAEKEAHISSLLQTELDFLLPLLLKFPKCYWIWNHRLFLLHQTSTKLSNTASLKFWEAELALVSKMLSRDARNFHGWGYRRTVVSNVEKQGGNSMVEEEFEYTTKMYRANLSNYSAWHNRSKLVPLLLEERKEGGEGKVEFMEKELETMQEAISMDPYDQSLHLYHNWLVTSLCNPSESSISIPSLPLSKRQSILNKQIEWMKELLEDEQDCRMLLEQVVSYVRLSWRLNGEERGPEGEVEEAKGMLRRLCEIDPMRRGRWRDIEARLG